MKDHSGRPISVALGEQAGAGTLSAASAGRALSTASEARVSELLAEIEQILSEETDDTLADLGFDLMIQLCTLDHVVDLVDEYVDEHADALPNLLTLVSRRAAEALAREALFVYPEG